MTNKLNDTMRDVTHSPRQELHGRLIERMGDERVPRARTAKYADSFVPGPVILFKKGLKRQCGEQGIG